jgi:hypothetical protein
MKKPRFQYVFLSHGMAESAMAQRLAEALAEQGIHVAEPATRALAADNFAASIATALKAADKMVVLLTPNSIKSPVMDSEISYALKHSRFKNNVVPIITGKLESYPWILRRMKPIQAGSDFSGLVSSVAKRLVGTRRQALAKAVA